MNAHQRRWHYGRITVDRLIHRQRVAAMSVREYNAYKRRRKLKRDNRRRQQMQRFRNHPLYVPWEAMQRMVRTFGAPTDAAARALSQLGIDLAGDVVVDRESGVSLSVVREGRVGSAEPN